jgi:hypothetical protein
MLRRLITKLHEFLPSHLYSMSNKEKGKDGIIMPGVKENILYTHSPPKKAITYQLHH